MVIARAVAVAGCRRPKRGGNLVANAAVRKQLPDHALALNEETLKLDGIGRLREMRIATCFSFFGAMTMLVAVRVAGTAQTFAVAMFGASLFLAAKAAVLVSRFRQSRREFERASQEYRTAGSSQRSAACAVQSDLP